ncbi:MAG: hypothetical protein V1697_01885 [Candidatus Levyibacteriota bacterium]
MKLNFLTKFNILFTGYLLSVLGLFFYSFTQVDLSLTLSQNSLYQAVEKYFQYVGYFDRPLSTSFYILILFLLFLFYILILIAINKNKINRRQFWIIILVTSGILTFSYNAFSYDLFNYIFDAKIYTHYHLNPYMYKALDFPSDPLLSFMRWTHRTYPYGPAFLFITIPVSYIGSNIFLVTFYLFKMLTTLFFLGLVYYLEKILILVNSKKSLFNIAFFALNPLVLIEILVSAHNDTSMMFFAILGIYLFLNTKWQIGFITILFSALIKQVTTLLLIPFAVFFISGYFKKPISNEIFIKLCLAFSVIGFIYVLTQIEVQPWYFLWVFPFIALLKLNKFIIFLTNGIIIGLLLRYAPFLYFGNWDGVVISIKSYVTVLSPIIALLTLLIINSFKSFKKS